MKQITMIKTDDYDTFVCKGADCRQTCCNGWTIALSKEEYHQTRKLCKEPGLLERMPEKVRTAKQYAQFVLTDRGCPLQTEEGLCGLQKEYGAEVLSRTCRIYPRGGSWCGDTAHMMLSPTCEKVLEQLWEKEDHIPLIRQEAEMPRDIISGKIPTEDKNSVWGYYLDLYQLWILILQAEEVSLEDRIILLGLALQQIEKFIQEKQYHKIPSYMKQFLITLEQTEAVQTLIPKVEPNRAVLLSCLSVVINNLAKKDVKYLELVTTVMEELQVDITPHQENRRSTITMSSAEYRKRSKKLEDFLAARPLFMEHVIVTLLMWKRFPLSPEYDGSVWDNYIYLCSVYSNLKAVLTACIDTVSSESDLIDICVTVFRPWVHNRSLTKTIVKQFHDTESDTLAHMVMMLKSC